VDTLDGTVVARKSGKTLTLIDIAYSKQIIERGAKHMAIQVDASNFEELKNGDLPVLIDFWAEWCGPCKAVAPVIEALAGEMDGKLVVGKCDVDTSGDLAAQFGVRSIPTMVLLKGGEEVERIVGAVPKDEILNKVTPHL
jgi:thioredoxin